MRTHTRSRLVKKIFSIILIFASSLILISPSYAVENGTLGAYPTTYDTSNPNTKSWFIYSLGANEKKNDSVTVENSSDQEVSAKVYAVDATITKDGAFALLQQTEEKKDMGSWIKLSVSQITLKAKEKKEIPFTVTVPKYVSIGDHAGGIVFENINAKTDNQQGLNVNLVSRIGVRVYDTVPGEQKPQLDIKSFTADTSKDNLEFNLTIENTGNVFLYPKGTIEVRDQFNNLIATKTLDALETQIPGRAIDFNIATDIKRPIFSMLKATLKIDYSSNKTASTEINFNYFNKTSVIIIAIATLLIIVLIVFMVNKKLKKRKSKRVKHESK